MPSRCAVSSRGLLLSQLLILVLGRYSLSHVLTLLHSEQPKPHRILAALSAIGLRCMVRLKVEKFLVTLFKGGNFNQTKNELYLGLIASYSE